MDNTQTEIIAQTIKFAQSYIGESEIVDNKGWKDKAFEALMKSVGWVFGWSWCALFAKLCYKQASNENYKLISANSQQTYRNFAKKGMVSKTPVVGGLMILHYDAIHGHTGIVIKVTDTTFTTIEGNSNNTVRLVVHKYNEKNLLGFCNPFAEA